MYTLSRQATINRATPLMSSCHMKRITASGCMLFKHLSRNYAVPQAVWCLIHRRLHQHFGDPRDLQDQRGRSTVGESA